MLKDIQITLYDIFGYFLPGLIILLAVWIAFRTMFWPGEPVIVWHILSSQGIVSMFLVAYLAGHLGQGVGNLFQKLPIVDPNKGFSLHPEIDRSLKQNAASRFGVKADGFTVSDLYELCDQALVHHGSFGEREIFTYREGFYRGNFVGLALLTCALVLRAIYGPTKLAIVADTMIDLGRSHLTFLSVTAAIGAWLAFQRYKRFAQYRIRSCFLRFLALTAESPSRKGGESK